MAPGMDHSLHLSKMLIKPEYLYGNYSRAKVEAFVSENATGWGNIEMNVKMMWGYWRPLEETVVMLTMSPHSELAYHSQAISNGTNKPSLVKKNSPPLGLPLAAMEDMQDRYSSFVEGIVTDDLTRYVTVPYDDQDSDLPQRLLQTITNFYSAALAAGDKVRRCSRSRSSETNEVQCEMLRQALEIHVTSTILERSLILDEASLHQVENHLQQQFPRRSAARLAQRQIKLAFYEIQRNRISKVLEEWGKEMWTSNKNTPPEKKWATSFSVLVTLTLVTYVSCFL